MTFRRTASILASDIFDAFAKAAGYDVHIMVGPSASSHLEDRDSTFGYIRLNQRSREAWGFGVRVIASRLA